VIVGQEQVLEEILIAIFARGHLPDAGRAGAGQDPARLDAGAGEWTCRSTGSSSTPDLMPSDITGTDVLQGGPGQPAAGGFEFPERGRSSRNLILRRPK